VPRTPSRPYGEDILDESEASQRGLGLHVIQVGPLEVAWDASRVRVADSATVDVPSAPSFAVADDVTTYLFVSDSGTVTANTTGYPPDALALMARVIAAAGAITAIYRDLTPYRRISESEHEGIASLVHELAQTAFARRFVDGTGRFLAFRFFTNAAETTKVRETEVTRDGAGRVATVVRKQYDAAGLLRQTLATTINRDGSGKFLSADLVES
jgi:hypothetical protein